MHFHSFNIIQAETHARTNTHTHTHTPTHTHTHTHILTHGRTHAHTHTHTHIHTHTHTIYTSIGSVKVWFLLLYVRLVPQDTFPPQGFLHSQRSPKTISLLSHAPQTQNPLSRLQRVLGSTPHSESSGLLASDFSPQLLTSSKSSRFLSALFCSSVDPRSVARIFRSTWGLNPCPVRNLPPYPLS